MSDRMLDFDDDEGIADAVDEWHYDDRGMLLHEFLGWTLEEYRAWMEQRRPSGDDGK